jgi:hypothetical protein
MQHTHAFFSLTEYVFGSDPADYEDEDEDED